VLALEGNALLTLPSGAVGLPKLQSLTANAQQLHARCADPACEHGCRTRPASRLEAVSRGRGATPAAGAAGGYEPGGEGADGARDESAGSAGFRLGEDVLQVPRPAPRAPRPAPRAPRPAPRARRARRASAAQS